MKRFLTIQEQIELLKNRGLIIKDEDQASRFLLRKNYYNTANVYGKYFYIDHYSEMYVQGSDFDDICALYDFEKQLRDSTFAMIMSVEANFRSTLAHFFANKFNEDNSYLDINNFSKDCKINNLSQWASFQNTISKVINNSRKKGKDKKNSINHYLNNFSAVPIWVLINEFTFGNLIAFYKLLDENLQDEIARSFEKMLTISYSKNVHLTSSELISYLDILSEFRNKIAHDSCLSVYRITAGKNTKLNDLNKNEYVSTTQSRNKFFDSVLLCRFFISKTAFYTYIQQLINLIAKVEERLIAKHVVSKLMQDLGINFNF